MSALRPQRNFLKVFDQMCKALRIDYIDCASFVYSGYGKYKGMLETLNPIMFESAKICDRTLTQMILEYLSWFDDPSLRLLVSPDAACTPFSLGYHVMRHGDRLYVDRSCEGAALSAGDQVVGVNGYTVDGLFKDVERVLMAGGVPEREDWSVVLAYAKRLKVAHPDGSVEELHDECPHVAPAPARHTTLKAVEGRPGVRVLRLASEDMAGLADALDQLKERATSSDALVVDARGVCGGTVDDAADLVSLVAKRPLTVQEAFGDQALVVNYTRRNVASRVEAMRAMEKDADEEARADVERAIADVEGKQKEGMVVEEDDSGERVIPASAAAPGRVVVLADKGTADAAEWFVRAAAALPDATVVGRATRGSLDNTALASRRLDDDFVLVYPTAAYRYAKQGHATRGKGIAPDVHVPWTPEFLEGDPDMDKALELAEA